MYYNLICIFICTPMWTKFYSCKKWVLHTISHPVPPWFVRLPCTSERASAHLLQILVNSARHTTTRPSPSSQQAPHGGREIMSTRRLTSLMKQRRRGGRSSRWHQRGRHRRGGWYGGEWRRDGWQERWKWRRVRHPSWSRVVQIWDRELGNMSRNSRSTWISLIFISTTYCKDALMREITRRCMVNFPYTGEFRWISQVAMSSMALCHFIQLIPRTTSIPLTLSIMSSVSNTHPTKSSWVLRTS
jgi:hypothetical protein